MPHPRLLCSLPASASQALTTCLLFGFQPELTTPLFARLASLRDLLFAATLGQCPCTKKGGGEAAVLHESLNSAQRVRVTPSSS